MDIRDGRGKFAQLCQRKRQELLPDTSSVLVEVGNNVSEPVEDDLVSSIPI